MIAPGPQRDLRLIADDLTGALDSACAFARPGRPVAVAVPSAPPPGAGPLLGLSTESRALEEAEAVARVRASVWALDTAPGALWFKKIDSVLRGHPVAETAAVHRAGRFDLTIVAPAFPAQGRTTRGGRQWVAGERDEPPAPVGPNLPQAFEAAGLPARLLRPGDQPGGPWPAVAVVDADDQATLDKQVAALTTAGLPDRVLWAGTAGLAQALGRLAGPAPPADPVPHLTVFVVGTNHPVSQQQSRLLAAGGSVATVMTGTDTCPAMPAESPVLLIPAADLDSAAAVDAALRRGLAARLHAPPPRGVFVTGGDTLSLLLQVTEARRLWCAGRVSDGVPLTRIDGGAWHGVPLVSKSGGFGDADLLLRLATGRP